MVQLPDDLQEALTKYFQIIAAAEKTSALAPFLTSYDLINLRRLVERYPDQTREMLDGGWISGEMVNPDLVSEPPDE